MASKRSEQYRGLSRQIVEQISQRKKEPTWMRELRFAGLEQYEKLSMPKFGPDLSGLKLENIASYVEASSAMVDDWAKVPAEIRRSFEELGIPEAERAGLAGVGAQYDSGLVYHNIRRSVAEQGVVYLGLEEALHSEYADMVRKHFMQLVPIDDHKFAALHAAVWSGGSFVYVPPRTSVEFPLQSYYRFNAPGAGQFEHTLIIVDEGADLHFIEGCSAPRYNVANLHAGCVEVFVGKNARMKYSTVESWSKNMYNLNTKRATVAEGGKIEWVTGSFGSHVSMLYPMTILAGRGASMEYTGVSFAGKDQFLDTGVKVEHLAPDTRSMISAKSLAKDRGENVFRSVVKITSDAKRCRSFTDCQSLMLDSGSVSNTIPYFDIQSDDAEVSHEANVGKISRQEIAYLMSRGLSEDAARALIVRGFANDISKELPFEYAAEMNNLIKLEMAENM
ncbi:Fe-S cluster assembly protein SufB [Candidatus Saccharibacteria bacterium]|nr:Fe-S cluster assembly protein SufB [Candidatus Saccharibacteria bacterium]